MSKPVAALEEALVPQYELANPLLRFFVVPLVRGTPVMMGDPINANSYHDFVHGLLAGDRDLGLLSIEMQRRAARMFDSPPLIELRSSDLDLCVAAYQFCWFFHFASEEGRVWERRQQNLLDEALELVASVEPPVDESQALTRHILLRHLPQVVRRDTHVAFNFLWSDLHFKGTEPRWMRLPGRRNPVTRKETIWLANVTDRPDVHKLFGDIIARSPLTRLLAMRRLYPHVSFEGTLSSLAVPRLCRFVSNEIASTLPSWMAPLAAAYIPFLCSADVPVLHRRYVAKFIYNVALTWCFFEDQESLAHAVGGLLGDGEGSELRGHTTAFYAIVVALHHFRGELGAAHLFSDDTLNDKVQTFVDAARIDAATLRHHHELIRRHLRFAGA